jgi:hypothetical protein
MNAFLTVLGTSQLERSTKRFTFQVCFGWVDVLPPLAPQQAILALHGRAPVAHSVILQGFTIWISSYIGSISSASNLRSPLYMRAGNEGGGIMILNMATTT